MAPGGTGREARSRSRLDHSPPDRIPNSATVLTTGGLRTHREPGVTSGRYASRLALDAGSSSALCDARSSPTRAPEKTGRAVAPEETAPAR